MAAFDYTSRDFDTIKRDLLARANRVFPEWTDRDPSDFGMLLVDLWAYSADVLHYYIDRAAGEAFLPTAQQRESVLAIANLLDYTPRGRSGAFAELTLTNSTNADVVIPALTEFVARHDGKTYFCYTENGGTVPALSSVVISVYEGALVQNESLAVSNGRPGQRFSLFQRGVVDRSIVVTVDEGDGAPRQYRRVPSLAAADTGERVFYTNTAADGTTEVVFGNAVNGLIPPSGSPITATYSYSSGLEGNLPQNSIVSFKAVPPQGIGIASSTQFVGGVDEEGIDSMKTSIPIVIGAQNRAVTRSDFVALTLQVSGVAKASVDFVPTVGGNASVTVFPQPQRGDYLTTGDTFQTVSAELQQDVVDFLQPLALLGVDVLCAPQVDWQPVDLHVTVHVNSRYVSNWVKQDVEKAIDTLFAFDNVFFGQRLTLGQVYRLILDVPGVDYCEVTLFDLAGDTAVSTDILIDELELPKKGTVLVSPVGGITTS
jgi:hypothetical protein